MNKFEERENNRKSILGDMVSDTSEKETTGTIEIKIEAKEKRTKRLNLLVGQKAYQKAHKKCDKIGISLNECINQFLVDWGNG